MGILGFSMTQPWGSLVWLGLKTIETRSWSTNHRGLIAIHTAKNFPGWAKEFAATERELGRLPGELPLGAIIAIARITDVRRTEEVGPTITPLERRYGDYSPGRFAWMLADVCALKEPVQCKGALGLFELPAEIIRQIEGQVR